MGNDNEYCCHKVEINTPVFDFENLIFKDLDFSKKETYEKLDIVALQIARANNIPPSNKVLIARLIANRQQHLLRAYTCLDNDKLKRELFQSFEPIQIELIDSVIVCNQLYHNLVVNESKTGMFVPQNMQPFNTNKQKSIQFVDQYNINRKNQLQKKGLEAIANGEIAITIMCGGNSHRYKKRDKFLIETPLPSKKSILEMIMLRIVKIGILAKCLKKLQIFIMINDQNYLKVKQFLKKNKYFQLEQKNVQVFLQKSMPVINSKGDIMLTNNHKIMFASNGAGDFLNSMNSFKFLTQLKKKGCNYIHLIGSENILEKPLDPIQIGLMLEKKSKVVAKCTQASSLQDLSDRFIRIKSNLRTISMDQIKQVKISQLKYGFVSMNSFLFDLKYLLSLVNNEKLQFELDRIYHVRRHTIPYFDPNSRTVIQIPHQNNGLVFQKYISDLFPKQSNITIMKVLRQQEYANVFDEQSMQIGVEALVQLHKKWLEIPSKKKTEVCEVHALVSYGGQGLEKPKKYFKEKEECVKYPVYIESK